MNVVLKFCIYKLKLFVNIKKLLYMVNKYTLTNIPPSFPFFFVLRRLLVAEKDFFLVLGSFKGQKKKKKKNWCTKLNGSSETERYG